MKEISLNDAKKIKLFSRIETKYKCDFYQFCCLSKYLYDNYNVVSDNGTILFDYMTAYFDTPDLLMFNDHKNNIKTRQKIRIREYSNGNKYLEIKQKNDGKTSKTRIPIELTNIDSNFNWLKNHFNWLKNHTLYNINKLTHILNVKYLRITFISNDYNERITIDFNIEFFNLTNNVNKKINDVIIEVKQNENYESNIKDILDSYNIKECNFSKYFNGLNYTTIVK